MRFVSIFTLLFFLSASFAQVDPPISETMPKMKEGIPFSGIPGVRVRPYPYAYVNNQFKVYVLVEIMYDVLQFIFKNQEYQAHFRNEIIFREKKSKESYAKIWSSSFSVKDFESTNRRDKFFLSWDSLTIPPGKYQVTFSYQDLQGKQKFQTTMNVNLPTVKNLFSPTPLFMVDDDMEGPRLSVFPARPLASWGQLPFNKNIKMLLNVYASHDSLFHISVTIHEKNKPTSLFQLDSLIHIIDHQGNLVIDIPAYLWPEGHYDLKINYQSEKDNFVQTVPIEIIWMNKPRSLQMLESALLPLQIILSEDEYKRINSGNKEERRRKFEDFWQKKDPTPQTAFNEILVEFYSRVDSVNKQWGDRRTPGWKTDPGKIILLYGHPNQVEDRSLDPVKPFMRWTYAYDDRIITFTFDAIRGRKAYRLAEKQERLIQ